MNCFISTLNCRGLRDVTKRHKLFKWLKDKKQDIMFLQETHSAVGDETMWKKEWGGQICFSHGKRDSRGVMIMFKPNCDAEVLKIDTGSEGRVLYVEVDINGIKALLVNIYAPNEDNPEFFRDIFLEISKRDNCNIIVGGDFNLVLDLYTDKDGGRPKTNENAQKCVLEYIDSLDLIDIWRIKHPMSREYTWCRRKPSIIQCRLDFFLISSCMLNMVHKVEIDSGFLSNHSLVKLCFKAENCQRGPGFWKLNCSLLTDMIMLKQ